MNGVRPVRLTSAGRTRLITLYVILGLLGIAQIWAIANYWRAVGFRAAMIVPPAILAFAAFIIYSVMGNERDLLRSGASTHGRVTQASPSPKGAIVTFEYFALDGSRHERTARDTSSKLAEGDTVEVLYDPQKPGRCVLTPGSFYEIV